MEGFDVTLPMLIQVGTIVAAAVWAVAKIGSVTKLLSHEIHTLGDQIRRLERIVEKIESKQHDHDNRLSLLEMMVRLGAQPHPSQEKDGG